MPCNKRHLIRHPFFLALATWLLGVILPAIAQPDDINDFVKSTFWPNDSVSVVENNTVEILRDVSDAYLATRPTTGNGFFQNFVLLHAFSTLSGPQTKLLFDRFPEITKVRLVLLFRKPGMAVPVVAAKVRINRATFDSAPFLTTVTLKQKSPESFLTKAKSVFDAVWMNDILKNE
ncbi:MAG: hypothetical protein A2293_05905 [Elusimicrobia bacterium RIFOXYB2_FULL_49_7]|nr:MAG: hypothetical protein A2293_05905 [Elusimicrobia bacterium RIFOXYB2_FULL_49_7]